jgi:hypothetical protein
MFKDNIMRFTIPNGMQWKGWKDFEWLDQSPQPDKEPESQREAKSDKEIEELAEGVLIKHMNGLREKHPDLYYSVEEAKDTPEWQTMIAAMLEIYKAKV